jgi:hypothetical protein
MSSHFFFEGEEVLSFMTHYCDRREGGGSKGRVMSHLKQGRAPSNAQFKN